ncbi:glycosyltransferase [Vibrio sp. T187]|uniref:glycosyltransferase family 2 protein n=1 Tax=Vibrio TaxID=662 RepID=UPI0010C97CED|nr:MULTISPECIES: glycosyltransferase family 2 protein [Vibrio]MBW3694508.1 glycosyltransferase [Vibrio sp. T187]
MMPSLSLIVPCYNEEDCFEHCRDSLIELLLELIELNKISETSHILFVDDGSIDSTWRKIVESREVSKHVRGIKLAKNVGHQTALIAGLAHCESELSVTLDADLQDDIDVISSMVTRYLDGYDIVFGVRQERATDTCFKKLSAFAFYKTLSAMKVHHIENHADFRLMSRRAMDALLDHNESNLYLRGLIKQLGFRSCVIKYARKERSIGVSKYPIRRMVSLALTAITSTSTKPLRLIAYMGFVISFFSFLGGMSALLDKLNGNAVDGWTSIMSAIFFLGGVQMLSLGIIGEYIGRIYIESKHRPRYFIEEESRSRE